MICPHCEEIIHPEEMDIPLEWKVRANVIYHNDFPVAQFLPNLGTLVMEDAVKSLQHLPGHSKQTEMSL